MTQSTPPGDLPLIEGLGNEWNELVSAIPEDKRAEFGPKLKERISAYEPLKQWEELQKSGVTPEFAGQALNVFNYLEQNPREVYKAIGDHLGLTPAEVKEVVKDIKKETENGSVDDSRIAQMEQQLQTLAQIALAQRQQSTQEREQSEQDALIEKEISGLKTKYGDDVNEEEVVMRMLYKNMTAEQAYQEYAGHVTELRKRRPSPMIVGGSGGPIPKRSIDVTKLDAAGRKNLVAEMLNHANNERNI